MVLQRAYEKRRFRRSAHSGRGPVTCRRCLKLTGAEPLGEQLEPFPTAEQDAPACGGDDAAGESP